MGRSPSTRTLFLPLILTFLLLLAGCQRSARAPITLSPEHLDLRMQYAQLHPEDPFLESIEGQEIRKGMNPTQVYLAWGRPIHRFKAKAEQKWVYEFTEDENVQPRLVAHLTFEKEALVRWRIEHSYVFFVDPETGTVEGDDFGDLRDLGGGKRPGR